MLVDRELVEGVVREQKYAKCQKAIDMLFTMNFYMQQVASVLQRMVVCSSVSQHVTTTSANKAYATSKTHTSCPATELRPHVGRAAAEAKI